MKDLVRETGAGRNKVYLSVHHMGTDLIVHLYNDNAHIGAIALGEYDHESTRASTSVITRLGHKDDIVALSAAHAFSKSTKGPVCVVAGIHLDDITQDEIDKIMDNCNILVNDIKTDLEEVV